MNGNIALVLTVAMILVAITISSSAPDAIAQRIQACMSQPNMQYEIIKGCVPQ